MAEGQQQAIDLGFSNSDELRAFKVGGWDAMIYEMGMSISQAYAERKYRKQLIEKWLNDGM